MLAVDLPVRMDLDGTIVGVMTAHHDAAAVANDVERLAHGVGMPAGLDHDVDAAAAREAMHLRQPFLAWRPERNGACRPHAAGVFQAILYRVHRRDLAGPGE